MHREDLTYDLLSCASSLSISGLLLSAPCDCSSAELLDNVAALCTLKVANISIKTQIYEMYVSTHLSKRRFEDANSKLPVSRHLSSTNMIVWSSWHKGMWWAQCSLGSQVKTLQKCQKKKFQASVSRSDLHHRFRSPYNRLVRVEWPESGKGLLRRALKRRVSCLKQAWVSGWPLLIELLCQQGSFFEQQI